MSRKEIDDWEHKGTLTIVQYRLYGQTFGLYVSYRLAPFEIFLVENSEQSIKPEFRALQCIADISCLLGHRC